MNETDIKALAAKHGLRLEGPVDFNEMGLDFQVAFATDVQHTRWVLRRPRRAGMFAQIEYEAKVLRLMRRRLAAGVPDWRIVTPELVAYPMLPDPPVVSFDPQTYAMTWNIEPGATAGFTASLARLLVDLHGTSAADAAAENLGIAPPAPAEMRRRLAADVDRVRAALGLHPERERRLRAWVADDRLWPDFSAFTHGDLYAGHVLARPDGRVTGVIDWSEAAFDDPALDFAGHLAVFGEESLGELIHAYAAAGGRTWDGFRDQIRARHAASLFKFAVFALDTGLDEHLATAKAQMQAEP